MAAALLRHRFGNAYEVRSAGTEPSQVNPWAIRVMTELEIEISGQLSSTSLQHWRRFRGSCDHKHSASGTCPVFPSARNVFRHSLEDPAGAPGSKEAILGVFCRVRDDIDRWIQATFIPSGSSEVA